MIQLQEITRADSRTVKIVRDDLYPLLGGGNKARKIVEIARDIESKQANAVVTTGGIQSNHCRAVALMAAQKGWKCKIIFHGDPKRLETDKGNALLVRMCGAEVEVVEASQIGPKMDQAMEEFSRQGLNPYYIYGGGHNIPGGMAYVKAVAELKQECEQLNWRPDYIVHASGTGSTQGGILAGLDQVGWENTRVIGISVARKNPRGTEVVEQFYEQMRTKLGLRNTPRAVNFRDEFLCGGYEQHSEALLKTLQQVAQAHGLILDPTYSGKAFWGMTELIKSQQIKGNILFWHTGGLLNLMA